MSDDLSGDMLAPSWPNLVYGVFNIHVDTSSNDSIKFQNCLESCSITQNVQTAIHLHGHILDLVLTPTDVSVISTIFNVFRTALPELLPTPPSIHTSLQLEKHYIGCRFSNVLSLRLPCLYISSYTVVTPNTLNPS